MDGGSSAAIDYDTLPLPAGWERAVDPTTQKMYYRDLQNQTTQWSHPNKPKGKSKPKRPVSATDRLEQPQASQDADGGAGTKASTEERPKPKTDNFMKG
jgi:hypothetical protein